jgi:hypothetical protein
MIQLSFTKDLHTPNAVWFDLLWDDKPDEYHNHFYGYQYLTEEEAEQMLDDPFITNSVKQELESVL